MNNYLLPIGSIVTLNGSVKPVMIYGVKQKTYLNPDKVVDYLAVPYPEGFYNEKHQYIFNHDDISNVIFRGYEDELRDVFIQLLNNESSKQ